MAACAATGLAQNPNWQAPNANQYATSMVVTAQLREGGNPVGTRSDQIAFFIGDELRGLSDPVVVTDRDGNETILHTANVYANVSNNQRVDVRVYQEAQDRIIAGTHLTFVGQSQIGTIDDPLPVALDGGGESGELTFSIPPEQFTVQGYAFADLDLTPFLITTPERPVTVTLGSQDGALNWSLQGKALSVAAPEEYTGTATAELIAESESGQRATQTVTYTVVPPFLGPQLAGLPNQVRDAETDFEPVDLLTFLDARESSAQSFRVSPQLASASATTPGWATPNGYSSSMTIVATAEFTRFLELNHPNDQLGAFVDGELRGGSFTDVVDGRIVHYLTIATNGVNGERVELRVYDAVRNAIHVHPLTFALLPGQSVGTFDTPRRYDFSPLSIDESALPSLEVRKRNPNWVGNQELRVIVADQRFPGIYADTQSVRYVSAAEPLPVELFAFTGRRQGDDAAFVWRVGVEEDVEEYQLQRSDDGGLTFITVSQLPAVGWAEYHTIDPNVFRSAARETVYYRLRILDYDGSMVLSEVVFLRSGPQQGLTVFPNPVPRGGRIQFSVTNGDPVYLTDVSGRTLTIRDSGGGAYHLSNDLPPGSYVLRAGGRYTRLIVY